MSRYDTFRRRVAPIALFLGIALIARDTCQKEQRTHTAVELQFGTAPPGPRAVQVEVVVGSETVATFHRVALPGAAIGPCRIPLVLTDEDGELRIDVDRGATHQRLTRRFHAVEGSTVTVTLPDPEP